jgi:excisionase family DNA binding protein
MSPKRQQRRKRVMSVEQAEAALAASRRARALKALHEQVAVSVPMAADLLEVTRQHLYGLIHAKKFPTEVIPLGRSFRIPSVALRALLQVEKAKAPDAA